MSYDAMDRLELPGKASQRKGLGEEWRMGEQHSIPHKGAGWGKPGGCEGTGCVHGQLSITVRLD